MGTSTLTIRLAACEARPDRQERRWQRQGIPRWCRTWFPSLVSVDPFRFFVCCMLVALSYAVIGRCCVVRCLSDD